jgi:gliding motility-associated lipoprotein GldH
MISIIFVLFLFGCDTNTIYREYNSFDDVSWNRLDILNFEIPVEKNVPLEFYFTLRHHTDFPYSFIDINITLYTPDGEMRSRDYHYGLKGTDFNWKGEGMGELWDVELPIRKGMSFKKSGICKIRVENRMNKIETPGIVEAGIIVKEQVE